MGTVRKEPLKQLPKKPTQVLGGQQGQATTEYVLLLAIVLSFFVLIARSVLFPKLQQLQSQFAAKIQSMYSGDNLHRLNFKVPKN